MLKPFVSPSEVESQAKRFKSPFEKKSFANEKVHKALEEGWELEKRNAKSSRLKRIKQQNVFFDQSIWNLIFNLSPSLINEKIGFSITDEKTGEYLPEFTVVGIDSEVILALYTLSSFDVNFKQKKEEILKGITTNKLKIANALKGIQKTTKKKLAIIVWTDRVTLSNTEKELLDKYNVKYFNENDLAYYRNLVSHLGYSARYQLYARLFHELDIPELPNRIPAIRGKMGGYQYYSFAIEPHVLLKIAYVLHRTSTSEESLHTYQRMVKKSRIKEINSFIDSNGFFPNSIIINIDTKKNKPLQFDLAQSSEHDTNTTLGILHLPKSYRSAFIIDGQHRLYGYGESDYQYSNSIPVVAFENLPPEVQSKLFIDINNKQKSVSRGLLLALDAELKWGSSDPKSAISAIQSKLIQQLGEREESPLYNRIVPIDGKESLTRCITHAFVNSYGLNRTGLIAEFTGRKVVGLGPLWAGDYAETTLIKAYDFFVAYFTMIKEEIPEQWEKGKDVGGFATKNVGISGFIQIAHDLFVYVQKQAEYNFLNLDAHELVAIIKDYIKLITSFLSRLNDDQLYKFGAHRGSTGPTIVRREFQKIIHNHEPSFNPTGLEEYLEKSSGRFTEVARDIILDMQVMIKDYVFAELQGSFGLDDWWDDGVPKNIRKSCSDRRIDDDSKDPDWNFIDLIHYESIIKANWDLLGEEFTKPGMEKSGKDKRVGWFNFLNDLRKKAMHPERGNISNDEVEELLDIKKWLFPRLEKAD